MDIDKRLKLMEEKLSTIMSMLRTQQPKKTWISASVLCDLTGWNATYLRKVRRYNIVENRKKGNIYEYCLESLDKAFITNTQK